MESFKEFLNEANVEYLNKEDGEKMIAVKNEQWYVKLMQKDFLSNKQLAFLIDKDQIDELCKILQKMK